MSHLLHCLQRLVARQHLSAEEAEQAVRDLVLETTSETVAAAFLTGLRVKGEAEDELLGCARALRSMSRRVDTGLPILLDTCGTGGDGSSSLNISTLAGLVAAAGGVAVAKHGNRSITSRCGSADLIEALGLPLLKNPEQVVEHLERFRFAFLFAPYFHPATARVGGVRRQLGFRTIFNLLGPLVNPAQASCQVIGVFAPEWCAPVARVAGRLGVTSCLVVHGHEGWDEITPWGSTHTAWWKDGQLVEARLEAHSLGLSVTRPEDLQGDSPEHNARESERLLRGDAHPAAEAVALNAAAGLLVAGRCADWDSALAEARAIVRTGQAWALVERLRRWSD